ncbi:Sar family guanine nucleotide exchange factor [Martiniozyma asiatica (nom. inval.)]|nr:Sar family guanine nucleotide exchange factor [Martiniozyma asiatica]
MALKKFYTKLDYPVYGAKFLDNDKLIVAGGGGETKSGVPNKVTVLSIRPTHKTKPLKRFRELNLLSQEDSVMSLDYNNGIILCGINENSEMMKKGINKHLRKFVWEDEHLQFRQSCQIHGNTNSTMYQKITAISKDGTVGVIVISDSPSTVYIIDCSDDLEEKTKIMADGDVKDVSISPDGKLMCYVTSSSFVGISTVTGRSVFTHHLPWATTRVKFKNNDEVILAGQDGTNAMIAQFSISNSKVIKQAILQRKLKGLTSMDLNVENNLIGLATSDSSVILVRLNDLKVIEVIKNAHTFSITKLVFSDDGTYVASTSAANSVGVFKIPQGYADAQSWLSFIFTSIWTTLLVAILAFVGNYAYQEGYAKLFWEKTVELIKKEENDISSYFKVEDVDKDIFTASVNEIKAKTIDDDYVTYSNSDITLTSVQYWTKSSTVTDVESFSTGSSLSIQIEPQSVTFADDSGKIIEDELIQEELEALESQITKTVEATEIAEVTETVEATEIVEITETVEVTKIAEVTETIEKNSLQEKDASVADLNDSTKALDDDVVTRIDNESLAPSLSLAVEPELYTFTNDSGKIVEKEYVTGQLGDEAITIVETSITEDTTNIENDSTVTLAVEPESMLFDKEEGISAEESLVQEQLRTSFEESVTLTEDFVVETPPVLLDVEYENFEDVEVLLDEAENTESETAEIHVTEGAQDGQELNESETAVFTPAVEPESQVFTDDKGKEIESSIVDELLDSKTESEIIESETVADETVAEDITSVLTNVIIREVTSVVVVTSTETATATSTITATATLNDTFE